jgi:hypothetical protein
MPRYYIFARIFLNSRGTDFPFDRFARVRDEEVLPELKKLRAETERAYKDRLKKDPTFRKEQRQREAAYRKRVEDWNAGGLAMPDKHSSGTASNTPKEPDRLGESEPDKLGDDILPRYALAEMSSKDRAEAICHALQVRVGELARAALNHSPFKDEDFFFSTTEMRFVVVLETDISPGEQISARDQITRLSTSTTPRGQATEEACLRIYLPHIQSLLKHCNTNAETVRHSKDFASVRWFGTDYFFTASQGACIKVLFEAWRNDTPELRQETILNEAGLDSTSIKDLFKNHPAFGSMITPGSTKGSFRLCEPK